MAELVAPQPDELDEANHHRLQRLIADAALSPRPFSDEKCAACRYYLDPGESFAYCWQPSLRVLVDANWWCQWWEEAG